MIDHGGMLSFKDAQARGNTLLSANEAAAQFGVEARDIVALWRAGKLRGARTPDGLRFKFSWLQVDLDRERDANPAAPGSSSRSGGGGDCGDGYARLAEECSGSDGAVG